MGEAYMALSSTEGGTSFKLPPPREGPGGHSGRVVRGQATQIIAPPSAAPVMCSVRNERGRYDRALPRRAQPKHGSVHAFLAAFYAPVPFPPTHSFRFVVGRRCSIPAAPKLGAEVFDAKVFSPQGRGTQGSDRPGAQGGALLHRTSPDPHRRYRRQVGSRSLGDIRSQGFPRRDLFWGIGRFDCKAYMAFIHHP